MRMPNTASLMTFDEFRAATAIADTPLAAVVRQQRTFFRDATSAEQAVRLALLSVLGWIVWESDSGAGA